MKHYDSLAQSREKLAPLLKMLNEWRLPATPINYAVVYHYVSKKSPALNEALDSHIAANGKPDTFTMEHLFIEFVRGKSRLRDGIVDDMDEVLSTVQKDCLESSISTQQLVSGIEKDITFIEKGNPDEVETAIQRLKTAALELKSQQQKFAEKVLTSQQRTKTIKKELKAAKKEVYVDAITGMYNRKGLDKHFDVWVKNTPDKHIGALVINIDQFQQFSEKFGDLMGDVILSKIAKKVSSYVDESGLPVRTGNHEFLVLMPDIDGSVLGEVAEKIRQGVEKIRFVSSKSGLKLPPMTVSLGVTEAKAKSSLEYIIDNANTALKKAQSKGKNQIAKA